MIYFVLSKSLVDALLWIELLVVVFLKPSRIEHLNNIACPSYQKYIYNDVLTLKRVSLK